MSSDTKEHNRRSIRLRDFDYRRFGAYFVTICTRDRRCAPTPPNVDKNGRVNVKPRSLGAIVRAFKSAVTRRVNRMRGVSGRTIWQRNYFERILRNEREWHACRCYIEANPRRWFSDVYYATDAEPAEGTA